MEDGFTKEEWKMVVETKKILDPKIKLTATCVRVASPSSPIPRAWNVEFEKPLSAKKPARSCAKRPASWWWIPASPAAYATPHERPGEDATFSRACGRPTVDNGIAFWCVSDNLRKGRR